jgi:two-component system OmpR family sensor kinase
MKSIRARLLFGLMLGTMICTAVALVLVYLLADAEADQQADLRLRQLAVTPPPSLYLGNGWPKQTDPDEDIVVQLWEGERVVRSSGTGTPLPLLVRDGYVTAQFAGRRWRGFAAPHAGAIVQVAQPIAVRQRQAGSMALRIALPFALLLPALGVLIWIVVGCALRPIANLTEAVAGSSPHVLTMIDAPMPPELTPIVAALNGLLAHIKRAMSVQRNFLTDAAHELRSPLAALKLELQIAERSADTSPAVAAQFANIRIRLDRATHMVGQLLDLARHEPGSALAGSRHRRRNLQELAASSIAEHAREAEIRNIDLGVAADSAPASTAVDAEALMVALRNLVDNALRYTPPGGKVDVSAGMAQGRPYLRVADNGPGIDADDRLRVFDRFYRIGHGGGAVPTSGCGLGMSIVRSVADMHGADVELADAPGGGLIVTMVLSAES